MWYESTEQLNVKVKLILIISVFLHQIGIWAFHFSFGCLLYMNGLHTCQYLLFLYKTTILTPYSQTAWLVVVTSPGPCNCS